MFSQPGGESLDSFFARAVSTNSTCTHTPVQVVRNTLVTTTFSPTTAYSVQPAYIAHSTAGAGGTGLIGRVRQVERTKALLPPSARNARDVMYVRDMCVTGYRSQPLGHVVRLIQLTYEVA